MRAANRRRGRLLERVGRSGARSSGRTFRAVSVGDFHACGLRTGGTLVCWGEDSNGETDPPSGRFTAVSAGGDHYCALDTGGGVTCWGSGAHGQTAPPEGRYTAVTPGTGYSCGLRTDGTFNCWGRLLEVRAPDGVELVGGEGG